MHKRIPIKNHQQEINLVTRRCMQALGFICLLIFFLIARFAYLQIVKHNMYVTLATKNWLDLVPVEPSRGLIYDRNGVLLAENIGVFSLDVIPFKVTDLNKAINDLKKIIDLSPSDLNQFNRQLKQHRRFDEITLKLRLTEDEVLRFAEYQYLYPGVMIKARLMRHYPYGASFSHVIGFVGRINTHELNQIDPINYSASQYIGKSGIEKYYEDELHGKVGYQEVESDASGKPVRVINEIKGTPGKNIYLTLDLGLQLTAEKALIDHRGAVVVIQPTTGQILAMVSEPSFDPNLFVAGITQKDYQDLQNSPDRPLYDRSIRGLYPLASTIKPYFALEGLDSGITTPTDTIRDPGWFKLPNSSRIYHDWQRRGHGTVNLNRAIMSSCDTYFYNLANEMGITRMTDILSKFGFGAPTGIDLNGEMPGVVASPDWKRRVTHLPWYPADTIMSAIGQGYMQATPLQLASAVATLANRGQRFMPYLQLGEQMPGKAYETHQPIVLEPITLQDKSTWEEVITDMEDVVGSPQGTAYRFGHNLSYSIAAKTGTAQVVKRSNPDEEDKQSNLPEKFRDHHLFIAFAPVDNPKIALAIVTENSNTAIEVARSIFDYYLAIKPGTTPNVRPTKEQAKKATP